MKETWVLMDTTPISESLEASEEVGCRVGSSWCFLLIPVARRWHNAWDLSRKIPRGAPRRGEDGVPVNGCTSPFKTLVQNQHLEPQSHGGLVGDD